jgi:hypothetical protein
MITELALNIHGNKRNYLTNFIQKISFMRYSLLGSTIYLFIFQYNLRFSYLDFGNNPFKSMVPDYYI